MGFHTANERINRYEDIDPGQHAVTVSGYRFAVDGSSIAVGFISGGKLRFGCHTLTAEAVEKLRTLLNER
jgi:hypothetical protein